MASSGSFSGSIKDGHYKLKISWTQTKNVSDNTSTIKCTAYLINDWSLSISGRSDNSITIAGTKKTYSSPSISSTGTHTLGTVSQTVSHDSDGSKSITIKGVFYIRATLSGTYYESISASATVTLDSIPRASTVSASAVTMGNATTISISRASSSFTHTLKYSFGDASGTIATKTTSTSVSWTPAVSLANQIPSATSGTCTITCTTYNGSTSVGSKTCTLKLTVPSSVKPTISSLTATRVDGTVPSTWGIYVQSKSKATLTINGAAGSYGSTISSYSISGGGYSGTSSTLTTGFLNSSGTITFTAKVTDSRGRTSDSATVSISVVAYTSPSFSSYSSKRCLSGGTLDDEGTYVKGTVSYTYSSCSSKNTVTRTTYYKKSTASSWTNASASFSSGTAFTFGGGNLSSEYSYDIKYTIADAFNTVTVYDVVSTAAVVMDFKAGGKGVAIGKVSEFDDTFEVSEKWDVKVYGQLLKTYIVDSIYPVGSIYMSVNSTSPDILFGGTWSQLQNRFLLGAGSSYTAGNTGGASTVTLTTSQIPSHTHTFTGSSATTSSDSHTHTVPNTKGDNSGSGNKCESWASASASGRTVTTSSDSHTHTLTAKGTNSSTGGGGSHNNMPPYLVVYMWKRTA